MFPVFVEREKWLLIERGENTKVQNNERVRRREEEEEIQKEKKKELEIVVEDENGC